MASDAVIEGVSGAIGGCIAVLTTYPLMTVSTQQATTVKRNGEGPSRPRGLLAEVLRIVEESGWRSLFGGIGTALFGTTVSQGIYFYFYSALRQALLRRRAERAPPGAPPPAFSVADSLLVAALAGMGNVVLTNPIWVVSTRLQAHQRVAAQPASGERRQAEGQPAAEPAAEQGQEPPVPLPRPGPVAVARGVLHDYGPTGFWKGMGASLIMVVNPSIQYALYEWLLAARVFVLSALAKAGATVLTYPMMCVKARLMSARKVDAHMQYAGIADAVRQIVAREGPLGLYQGMRAKIVQSVLAAALLFMAKEKITEGVQAALSERRRAGGAKTA